MKIFSNALLDALLGRTTMRASSSDMLHGLNERLSNLTMIVPMQNPFPNFIHARFPLLLTETHLNHTAKLSTTTALFASTMVDHPKVMALAVVTAATTGSMVIAATVTTATATTTTAAAITIDAPTAAVIKTAAMAVMAPLSSTSGRPHLPPSIHGLALIPGLSRSNIWCLVDIGGSPALVFSAHARHLQRNMRT